MVDGGWPGSCHEHELDAAWARMVAFARTRWPSLLFQAALLLCTAAVFDVIPDRVVAPLVPAESQETYWAVLLAVKNPTVIAFTLVWLVGAVRQMLLTPAAGEAGGPPGTADVSAR